MEEREDQSIRMRKFIFYIIIFFFLCGIGAVYYSTTLRGSSKKGILRLHGWVEGTEVSLSAKVGGELIQLNVEEGSEVKKGDLIAQISSEQIQSRIANADAQIERARGGLKKAQNQVDILRSTISGAKIALELAKKQSKARIKQAEASLASAEVVIEQVETNFAKAEKDYVRFSSLAKKKSISQSKMDAVEEAYKLTKSEVERATRGVVLASAGLELAKSSIVEIQLRKNDIDTLEKKLNAAMTDKTIAEAALNSALALKSEIKATHADTFISAPVKGTVTDKVIETGENVVPGTPIVVLTDLSQLYAKTYVEQVDIGKVKLDDPCRVYVDSFPKRYFEGRVILVASKAEFTPRDVQMDEHRSSMVYKIKVGIDNLEGILKPGMPADIDLKWDRDKEWK
ncbi:MAG: efflux RND transporter periplasmic adaptor subunit [Thermodesulfobacteriota bacterium]|nr:efflux RND transporter periplasmic adaptor subunit [Thermodesulfobacteriota bacterium]